MNGTNINFERTVEDINTWLGAIRSNEIQIRSALETIKEYKKATESQKNLNPKVLHKFKGGKLQ